MLGTALMLFGGAGSRFSFGIFLKPVTEELDWTRGSLAGAIAIAGLATGGLRPVAGILADRYDPKTVAAIGVAIGGLALAGMSAVQELWHAYILFIVMGIGFTLASPAAVANHVVALWSLFCRYKNFIVRIRCSRQLIVDPVTLCLMSIL